ncbi:beta strand repeat-containing protein, partial [Methylobacterium bullatum]|uniref:beta strand repeat-containing protein n=1 Tax=Methylobacterium bullatum TaxID=570505 RepID=UPI001EE24822
MENPLRQPMLTGTQNALALGAEDTVYTITKAQLLANWSDPDGEDLSVTGLTASRGTVVANPDGSYTITQIANANGVVTLNYSVSDGITDPVPATRTFTLAAVNDAPSFGGVGTGIVITPVGTGTSFDPGRSVKIQADGKIVVAGAGIGSDGTRDFALIRYNADGSLDTSFGPNGTGKILTSVASALDDQGQSVTLQADGKIVVAGQALGSGTGEDFAVVRYNANGSLDTSFGTGGKIITQVGAGSSDDIARSITVQADGKIVAVGYGAGSGTGDDFAVVRYNTDGSLDTGFGTGGKILTPVGAGTAQDQGLSVTVQADGKIVVAGSGLGSGTSTDFAVVRYTADGSLDTGFGTGGKILTPIGAGTSSDIGQSVTVQPDGKILVAGYGQGSGSGFDFELVRYNADGSLDTSFGPNGTGKILTPVGAGTSSDIGFSVTVQADGKIVVAGTSTTGSSTGTDFAVVRYNANGSLDTGFGPDGTGKIITPVGAGTSNDQGQSVTVQADGKIVVVGYGAGTGTGTDVAVVRYNADGSLDTTFNAPNSLGGTVAFTENGNSVRLDTDVTLSDVDLDALNGGLGDYAGATLTLARQGGANAQDAFGFDASGFTVSGNSLRDANGATFATFTDTAGTLTITFTGTNVATSALADAVARAVTYANTSDTPPTSATLVWTFSDGNAGAQGPNGAATTTGTTTVMLLPTNDAPILSGTQAALAVGQEDTVFTVTAIDLLQGFSDPDGTALVLSGLSVDHGTIVSNGAGGYTVTPTANYNGPLVISYNVGDGTTSIPATLSTTLTAVNDAPSFLGAGTGKVLTPASAGTLNDFGHSVTMQADGKIIVVGEADGGGTGTDFAVVRYNADGSLDTSFGTGGKILTPVGTGTSTDVGQSVTVQADGKIVVAGQGAGSDGQDFAVVRYNADGSLDTSFGTGGKILTPVGTGMSNDIGQSVKVQADGKIVVAGYGVGNGDDFAVVRYNTDGSLDTSFGTGGKILTPVGTGTSNDGGNSLTVQADGKIVVAGYGEGSETGTDFAVVRYNADGSLDTSFGTGGTILTPVGTGTSTDFGNSVTVQADGKIVVAGYGTGFYSGTDFAMVRYNANGSLDTTFGSSGKILTPISMGPSADYAYSVTVQADGKIVVAGQGFSAGTSNDFAVVRYNADGSLDTGFGTGGKILTSVGTGSDTGQSVTVQADGKIVVAGYGQGSGTGYDFAVVRYNADGSLDTSFNLQSSLGGTVAFTENGNSVRLDTDVTLSDVDLDALNGGLGDYAGATLTLARQGGADAQD